RVLEALERVHAAQAELEISRQVGGELAGEASEEAIARRLRQCGELAVEIVRAERVASDVERGVAQRGGDESEAHGVGTGRDEARALGDRPLVGGEGVGSGELAPGAATRERLVVTAAGLAALVTRSAELRVAHEQQVALVVVEG